MYNKQNRLNQKIHIDVILIYNQADLKQLWLKCDTLTI